MSAFAKALLHEQRVLLPSEADELIRGSKNHLGLVDACRLDPGGDQALLLLEALLLEQHSSRALFTDAFVRISVADLAASLRLDKHAQNPKTRDSAFNLALAIAGDRREVAVMLLGEANMSAFMAFCAPPTPLPLPADRTSNTTPPVNLSVSSAHDADFDGVFGPTTWDDVGPLDNDEKQGFVAFQPPRLASSLANATATRPLTSTLLEENPLRLPSARKAAAHTARLQPLSAHDEAVALLETTYAAVGRDELALGLPNLGRSMQSVAEARRRLVRAHLDDMLACRDAIARLSSAAAQGLVVASAAHRDLAASLAVAQDCFAPLLEARAIQQRAVKAEEARAKHAATLGLAAVVDALVRAGKLKEAVRAVLDSPANALVAPPMTMTMTAAANAAEPRSAVALARAHNREAARALVARLRAAVVDDASEEACELLLALRQRRGDLVGEDPAQLIDAAKLARAHAQAEALVHASGVGDWLAMSRVAVRDLADELRPSELGGHARQRLRTCVASMEQHASAALELAAQLLARNSPGLAQRVCCGEGEVRVDALACLSVAESAAVWRGMAPAADKTSAMGLIATAKTVPLALALPEGEVAVAVAKTMSAQCADALALTLELHARCLPSMDITDGSAIVARAWADAQARMDLTDALQARAGPAPLLRASRALGNLLGKVAEQSRGHAAQQPLRFLDLAREVGVVKAGIATRLPRSGELHAQVERLESALVTQFLKASAVRVKARVDAMAAARSPLGRVSDDALLLVLDVKEMARACSEAVGARFGSKVKAGLAKVAAERACAVSPAPEQLLVDAAFCASHFDAFKVVRVDEALVAAQVAEARRKTVLVLCD